ncbi:MAG: hypothetical protein L0Z71_17590 [Anaerolineae bacterium]|nr:hypothetical protein [Anaerolineae bacterium]
MDPVAIYECLNTSDKEKELLLSTNPEDEPAASALFNQKILLNQQGWKSEDGATQDKLEIHLMNYANWLKALVAPAAVTSTGSVQAPAAFSSLPLDQISNWNNRLLISSRSIEVQA